MEIAMAAFDAAPLVAYSPLAHRALDGPRGVSWTWRREAMSAPRRDETSAEEWALVMALRRGDEHAFMRIVERFHLALIHLAQVYVGSRAVAEEVAQDTWVAVLQGIGRFEGRSSLKTWIFHILSNRAKTRAEREGRVVPFSALTAQADEGDEPSVEPERFRTSEDRWPGGWRTPPESWEGIPEQRLLGSEMRAQVAGAIAALPPNQRTVITLRDVEGWGAEEVRDLLGISDVNQRVLLHRGRSKVRAALERYLDDRDDHEVGGGQRI